MSSPIARSSDTNGVSPYAPKWARNLDCAPGLKPVGAHLPMATDDSITTVPAVSPNLESERFGSSRSLDPVPVPEPPMPEPWLRNSARSLARSERVIGVFFPLLLAILLAALIAFVIVVELPNIQSFLGKQRAADNSFGTRFDGEAVSPPAWSSTPEAAPWPAGTMRSDSPPTTADRQVAAINPASAAPVPAMHRSPVNPIQLAIATPAPAASRLTAPMPGAIRPPAANQPPTAEPVHDASVTTVPIRPYSPARPLGHDEIETLLKQGNDFISVGDFASARLVFGRVSEANDARGALAFAATYDPIVLANIGAKGAASDIAKAREWYAKAKELGSPEAAARLDALANGAAAFPTNRGSAIPGPMRVAMVSTGKVASNDARSQNPAPSSSAAPPGSYWKNDQSIMRLEATGIRRKFYFYTPSDDQLKAGAKVGSLRFDGKISESGYAGTAFLYSEKCGRLAFRVSGEIEESDGRVILSGRAPRVDSDCQEVGTTDQKLVFQFIKTTPK